MLTAFTYRIVLACLIEFTAEPQSIAVLLGQPLLLNCSAHFVTSPNTTGAAPAILYVWELDLSPVSTALPSAYQFTNHSLYVTAVTSQALGSYRCVASSGDDVIESENATVVLACE